MRFSGGEKISDVMFLLTTHVLCYICSVLARQTSKRKASMPEAPKYILPEQVTSPRRHWTLLVVLDPGDEQDIAVCVGRWDEEPCLGMRWNGSVDNPLGNPQSR